MKNIVSQKITLGLIILTAPLLFILPRAPLAAQEPAAQDETRSGSGGFLETISASTDLSASISTRPEAKLTLTQSFTMPMLQGDHALFKDNNLRAAASVEVSPISLNGGADFTLTPAAFFQLMAGTKVGTGWNIYLGAPVRGIGIVRLKDEDEHTAEIDGYAWDGAFWRAHVGGALQFDLAAIFPGDWNHVVLRTYHEMNYKLFSRARGNDPWYYEADLGENQNGFNYYGNLLVGYQMPIFLNTVGILTDLDLSLYDTPDQGLWGGELPRWHFALLLNFTVTEWFQAALITQFRTMRTYTGETRSYEYFRDRRMDSPGAMGLEFYRVAAILNFHIR